MDERRRVAGDHVYCGSHADRFQFCFPLNNNPAYRPSDDEGGSFGSSLSASILAYLNGLGTTVPAGNLYPNFASTLLAPKVNAVVQGATFQPGLVSGSWMTLRGNNLATASRP